MLFMNQGHQRAHEAMMRMLGRAPATRTGSEGLVELERRYREDPGAGPYLAAQGPFVACIDQVQAESVGAGHPIEY